VTTSTAQLQRTAGRRPATTTPHATQDTQQPPPPPACGDAPTSNPGGHPDTGTPPGQPHASAPRDHSPPARGARQERHSRRRPHAREPGPRRSGPPRRYRGSRPLARAAREDCPRMIELSSVHARRRENSVSPGQPNSRRHAVPTPADVERWAAVGARLPAPPATSSKLAPPLLSRDSGTPRGRRGRRAGQSAHFAALRASRWPRSGERYGRGPGVRRRAIGGYRAPAFLESSGHAPATAFHARGNSRRASWHGQRAGAFAGGAD
jgi:hypothetical protein